MLAVDRERAGWWFEGFGVTQGRAETWGGAHMFGEPLWDYIEMDEVEARW